MTCFNVTYDLRKKSEFDYQRLWDEFKRLQGHKYQESAYFLDLNASSDDVLATLKQYVHSDDWIMVTEFSVRPTFTHAYKGTNAWLDARFG